MNQRILFNFASRSRPDKFKKVVRNIAGLCMSDNYEIIAKIDDDDPHRKAYVFFHPNLTFVEGISKNKIHAINRDIPKEGWDIIVDVSDDFVFTKKGFDNVIRKYCGPDDCLHFPEPFANKQSRLNRNDDIIIMAVMGKQYFDRFGYIFNPAYKSLFCDNELTAVAKLMGAYKLINQQIFYHAHPQAGFGKADEQTKFTESFWNEDKKIYEERKLENFPL
jgi:hypothetical protein